MDRKKTDEILNIYNKIKYKIVKRISEFKTNYNKYNDEELFAEFAFCLLTPQSKAKLCWQAIERLKKQRILFEGSSEEILKELYGIRFKYKKSGYIIWNRNYFSNSNILEIKNKIEKIEKEVSSNKELRNFLAKEIKGYGYKEATHFLRNIGKGDNLAILDRHILKNMVYLGVIDIIPKSISSRIYFELENKFLDLAKVIGIDSQHLDFVLWYKEANEVFK